MNRPNPSEYPSYYEAYIQKVNGNDVISSLKKQHGEMPAFFSSIPAAKENYRYAEGKWTVKDVLGHITDTERIMAYRALSFARGEKAMLPGFDENVYTPNGNFSARSLQNLEEELSNLRQANISLFSSFSSEVLLRKGNANGKEVSVRAILWMIAGHELHHRGIIAERYLGKASSAAA